MASSDDNDRESRDASASNDNMEVELPPHYELVTELGLSSDGPDFGLPDMTSGRMPDSEVAESSDQPGFYGDTAALWRRETVVDACRADPKFAQGVLDTYSTQVDGWCEVVSLAPTKEEGYVQLSYGGANKFSTLGLVLLWANGLDVTPDKDQCSHLCPNKGCKLLPHVLPESAKANNNRKGCLVWIDCHHCGLKIFVCMHRPHCIKFCMGYSSPEDFLARGVCRVVRDDVQSN